MIKTVSDSQNMISSINNFPNNNINNFETRLKAQHQQKHMDKPSSCDKGMNEEESCVCKPSETNIQKNFVYAIGKIKPKFPSIGIEKEYFQVVGRTDTAGQTDYEVMKTALSKKENQYLLRQMCWVLSIGGIDTYILKPSNSIDFNLLAESLTSPRNTYVDVVIGTRGPIAPPTMCDGLMVPIVDFEQIYSLDVATLMKTLPKPADKAKEGKDDSAKSKELLHRIMQMADNVGATDEHRSINYLAVRYPAYYEKTTEMHDKDFSLFAIEVKTSRLSGSRKILDCIFTYTNRKTGINEKWFCRVDSTELFPFLVTPISPYYDRE
ncbi:MAG TPA: hypothetical protein VFZ46_05715 [Nitrososphaeraceae archaeon]